MTTTLSESYCNMNLLAKCKFCKNGFIKDIWGLFLAKKVIFRCWKLSLQTISLKTFTFMTYRSPSLVLGSVSILNCPLSFPLVTSKRAFQLEVFTKSLSSTGILVTSTFSWFSWTLALYCFKKENLIDSLKIKYHTLRHVA